MGTRTTTRSSTTTTTTSTTATRTTTHSSTTTTTTTTTATPTEAITTTETSTTTTSSTTTELSPAHQSSAKRGREKLPQEKGKSDNRSARVVAADINASADMNTSAVGAGNNVIDELASKHHMKKNNNIDNKASGVLPRNKSQGNHQAHSESPPPKQGQHRQTKPPIAPNADSPSPINATPSPSNPSTTRG